MLEQFWISLKSNLFTKGENLITKQEERYKAWSESAFKAFIEGDVDVPQTLLAENYKWMNIDAFGEHHISQGPEAILQMTAENWGMKNPRLLKNELICASKEKGVFNAIIRWTDGDNKEWASDFIYVITLDENDRCTSYTEWNVVNSREK